jgi:hypothetical protein
MAWWHFWKIFNYSFSDDPLSARDNRTFTGAGVSQPDAVPDIRAMSDGTFSGRGQVRLRDSNEFVDLSTVTNRIHRYKEYERLRIMPEIEMAITVFGDETCLDGDTLVATPAYEGGFRTLKWLADNMADERFLVYAYDFNRKDYTLAWAHSPRLVKRAKTVKIILDNGDSFIATPEHRILLRDGTWCHAAHLRADMKLMPFYRVRPNTEVTKSKSNQYPRIFTHNKGWVHERQFVDEWRTGKELPQYQEANRICRMICDGLTVRQIHGRVGRDFKTIQAIVSRAGFSNQELKLLSKKADYRRVVGVLQYEEMDVYDLSVETHENFCTNWGVAHNCQKNENNRCFDIKCKNQEIKEELEFLWFHRKMINMDQKKLFNRTLNLYCNGDEFWETVVNPENPKDGIVRLEFLPCDSMYRIETTKGRLLEFQQSKEGPDYESIAKIDVMDATEADLMQCRAVRFHPNQIVHLRIGADRKTFYPYGVSLIEPARGPAHSLRIMEDSMIVYRLSRAPERRVFYIDTQGIPPAKAEAFMERVKDQLKKKKTPRNGAEGASSVEERWHPPSVDEDIFIQTRPNSNTRVEPLPGAQNLGEVDDTVYFRNKLFMALNFPKNYFNNEDSTQTRVSLSSLDVKFARLVERLQSYIEDALWEVCDRHLKLRGFPEESYEDLEIKMTPPSDWRELTRAEVINNRIQNAGALKGAQIMSDYDILTKVMKYSEEDAKVMLARLKQQKIGDLQLQIIAQNPTLAGVGLPGDDEDKVSADPSEQNPMLGGEPPPPPGEAPEGEAGAAPVPPGSPPQSGPLAGGAPIPEPEEADIKKYGLYIKDYGTEQDDEEIDGSDS